MCSADEECVSAFGKDARWLAERSGKGNASSPGRQSRAQQGHGDRGRTLRCVGSGQRRPWLARGTPSRGVSSSYQLSLKRLSLWTSNSCPYLGPTQALIGFWNNSSPGFWEPGGQATLPAPRPSSVWGESVWGDVPRSRFRLVRVEKKIRPRGPAGLTSLFRAPGASSTAESWARRASGAPGTLHRPTLRAPPSTLASKGEGEFAGKKGQVPRKTTPSPPGPRPLRDPAAKWAGGRGPRANAVEARPPGSSPRTGGTQAPRSPSESRRPRLALTHLCAYQVGPPETGQWGLSPHPGAGAGGGGGGNAPPNRALEEGAPLSPPPDRLRDAWGPGKSWQGPCTVTGAGRQLPARTGGTRGLGFRQHVLSCAEQFVCK